MTFDEALLNEIMINKNNNYHDNYNEWMKFEADFVESQKKQSLLSQYLPLTPALMKYLSVKPRFWDILMPVAFYKKIVKKLDNMSMLYKLLSDDQSKQLLIKILAYRVLGYKKVKLPRNTAQYWAGINQIKKLDLGYETVKVNFMNLELDLFDLLALGYNIKLNGNPEGIACIYIQHQYDYRGHDIMIKAQSGDVVLDCGACWGDTALYFAHEVGSTGMVYAFEFLQDNLNVMRGNIVRNPHLSNNIQVVEQAVWDESDKILSFADNGPGTQINEVGRQTAHQCNTITIDDFVENNKISKIDFIKMDIEGAELKALKGAEKTIKKFKPKLAISAYHKADDFFVLPNYLNGLNVGYKFYLEHHTIHKWETVLYATASHF